MGFNCNNNDSVDLADKIKRLIEDSELCSQMGKNARRCAEQKFDRKRTYQAMVNIIKEIKGGSNVI